MTGEIFDLGSAPQDALMGLDLFFAVEGAGRLLITMVSGLPVGSVLGLPFVTVYQRWADSDDETDA